MASIIAAGTTSGTSISVSGDTSGQLVLQTNGTTTAVTISTGQVVTLAQPLPVASGGSGVTTSTGTGAKVLGTSPTMATPTFDSAQLATVVGTAPLYMCRAWVNFNGTGTVAIRGSGNVSSITDNGTGDYTVNFTTAMSDGNYSATFAGGQKTVTWGLYLGSTTYGSLSGSHRFFVVTPGDTAGDTSYCSIAFFR